ncbi:PucR family transcriptional regulator ligand-binding domain-containing protein [Paenibacillus sp. HN-1]|uniref:PucR family transcriptional regulator n=1 Tax=Paenibacillus TaxID=44249 RepID=UPI001CA9CD2B|nr:MULTISPECIES: PucR family transcriptional regulator [Paenibacillus]MBY9080828.1 PucR family transcriptional regulator ligand-binding domain-containing protein [Paenibacillus sp. CGMCC 1.18879]MBY9085180.1 PucR family transcriptional regulator ligand-binding domain-containing protein [Paenibacillus sinensis]
MHLTVEEALSVYPLSEARLIAGSKGTRRIVKSINVMDAPDISDWIKEGEMLLTTAYLIKDSPDQASALLHKLNRRGSSGLGIKLGRFWDAVPESLIAEADELGFPLIELPFQFTFSDQMNGLFRAELSRSTGALQTVLEKQRRLMRFALEPVRSRSMLESVSECVGHPLAVIGSRGELLFHNSSHQEKDILAGWPWQAKGRKVRIGQETAYRLPLAQGEECGGFLIFFGIDPLMLTMEESLFVQGAELIAHHMPPSSRDYFEQDLHREFGRLFRRFLKGDLTSAELTQAAESLNPGLLQTPFQLVLTDVPEAGELRQHELNRLKEEYLQHPELSKLKSFHLMTDEGLLSLLSGERTAPEAICKYIEACFEKIGIKESCYPCAAVSSRKSKPDEIREAFGETKEALRMRGYWNPGQQVAHYRQLELAMVLRQIPSETMQKYSSRTLAGLLGREPEYVREMLHTLEAFLENDGHINETAKKLFIHRNTATYRMEKLSELLDVDFRKTDDLLRLRLAFLFRNMLERG